jgi:hypothetical protein
MGFSASPGPLPSPDREDCCIVCGEPLEFLPHSYPLVFRCENDHLFTLGDFLNQDLPEGRCPENRVATALTLLRWRKRSRMLNGLANRAIRNGHAFVAADFKDAARRIDGWVRNLRLLLSKIEASVPAADA